MKRLCEKYNSGSPVLLWRLLHHFAEAAGEIVAVGKAAVKGDVRDGAVGAFQECRRFPAADMHQVVDRRTTDAFLEDAGKVAFGEV